MKQAIGHQICPSPQKSDDHTLSKYTLSNTTELNSNCVMNASPTNSTNQIENL